MNEPDRLPPRPVEVDFIADLACPWCYLGLLRFDRARRARPARLRWRAFLLNPRLPPEGVPRERYLLDKFGSLEAVAPVHARIAQGAPEEGVEIAFERIRRTPNTQRAQRLVIEAERYGLGEAMMHALFRALFVDGRDIGDRDTLGAIAAEVGLAAEIVRPLLEGEAPGDVIQRHHVAAARAGITGVPVYVFAGRHAIAGAQPVEVLEGLLELASGVGERAP